MKKALSLLLCAALTLSLTACGGQTAPQGTTQTEPQSGQQTEPTNQSEENVAQNWEGAVNIELSDTEIKVDGQTASTDETAAVYVGAPIVYYEEGKDFTYGEGEEGDAHSADEAAAHTVVTITKPGTYVLRGKLSFGQVAVDLGKDAKEDPEAVVTLVMDGVDITCTVAPAVIFYNVYECGSDDADTATKDVDTSAAGANVYINGGTQNDIYGSYVARIYKPDSVVLSADGTEVEDAKKLHKYDAAFYSKMSMNVDGDNGGVLHINAENEGLDSELHLTINGGNIYIISGNDGINTNEDGVSVTTVNGGELTIRVAGTTGEGDGIDSNGWLVINDGTVVATACSRSMDAGIDSDMGIHIGAGATVIATGHMLDRIDGAGQNYAVFQFAATQSGDKAIALRDEKGTEILNGTPMNDYSVLIYSSPSLTEGNYTLWSDGVQLGHSGAEGGGMMGGMPGGMGGFDPGSMELPEGFQPGNMDRFPGGMEMPEGMEIPGGMERPEGMQMPEGMEIPEGMEQPQWGGNFDPGAMPQMPGNMQMPEGMEMPEGFDPSQMGQMGGMPGGMGGRGDRNPGGMSAAAAEAQFTIAGQENYFSGIGVLAAQ